MFSKSNRFVLRNSKRFTLNIFFTSKRFNLMKKFCSKTITETCKFSAIKKLFVSHGRFYRINHGVINPVCEIVCARSTCARVSEIRSVREIARSGTIDFYPRSLARNSLFPLTVEIDDT